MYKPVLGNLTAQIRYDYIEKHIKKKILLNSVLECEEISGLYANKDINKPIYFWQLYNILGEAPVKKLITIFYTSIFNDKENIWFVEEFTDLGSLEHHINRQTSFWLDVMGGGARYYGNLFKLNKKHKLVRNIMTEKGANLWFYYMKNALKQMEDELDKRVLECLVDFLNFFMDKYSHEFDFNFYELKSSL